MQAVVSAAQHILLEEADIILAGGTENMSQSPYSNFEQRFSGAKLGNLQFDDMLQATLTDEYTIYRFLLQFLF
jgi:acetyl-CoA acyltransferase 2